MKNGDNLFEVFVEKGDTVGETVRADRYEVLPSGALHFITYSGPQQGHFPVRTFAHGNWADVKYEGEHRDSD